MLCLIILEQIFFAFADLLKNQEKSEYQSWYHITRFPVREEADCYECFLDLLACQN